MTGVGVTPGQDLGLRQQAACGGCLVAYVFKCNGAFEISWKNEGVALGSAGALRVIIFILVRTVLALVCAVSRLLGRTRSVDG